MCPQNDLISKLVPAGRAKLQMLAWKGQEEDNYQTTNARAFFFRNSESEQMEH